MYFDLNRDITYIIISKLNYEDTINMVDFLINNKILIKYKRLYFTKYPNMYQFISTCKKRDYTLKSYSWKNIYYETLNMEFLKLFEYNNYNVGKLSWIEPIIYSHKIYIDYNEYFKYKFKFPYKNDFNFIYYQLLYNSIKIQNINFNDINNLSLLLNEDNVLDNNNILSFLIQIFIIILSCKLKYSKIIYDDFKNKIFPFNNIMSLYDKLVFKYIINYIKNNLIIN
jgi:hypothetical protein